MRPKVQLRNSVRRHGEVHLGRAPGALAGTGRRELSAGRQVVGAHNVPRVRCQGQGVAVHARCARGVRGQDRQQTVHLCDGVVAEQGGGDA